MKENYRKEIRGNDGIRKTTALVQYRMRIYGKENRFIMPLAAMLFMLYIMYSMKPAGVVSSFFMSSYMIFLIAVWNGFVMSSAEDPVMEQIQMLRVQNIFAYYVSKIVCLLLVGLAGTCICLVLPVAVNVINDGTLFERTLTGYDLFNAFLLLSGASFAGGTLGSILQPPMVLRERKNALLLTVLAAVLTIIKQALMQEIPLLKWILWILPPLERAGQIYGNADFFLLSDTVKIFLLLMTYAIIYSMIKSVVSHRRKFA